MSRTLEKWDVEDSEFWESTGKKVANRNLWISIPNLLLGFSVWLYWGMIAKYIQDAHFGSPEVFNFTFLNDGMPYADKAYKALLFLLPAVAGLAGATLRIPNSFMIAIAGGRNVKFMTTLLLILPALGTGLALQDPNVSFATLIGLATLSGIGGGAFASSMSNISFFFPKRMQGLALGLNAGLGNFGVSVMQFLIPWVITIGLFGAIGGDPHAVPSTVTGSHAVGMVDSGGGAEAAVGDAQGLSIDINGTTVAVDAVRAEDEGSALVEAINAVTGQTGVTASMAQLAGKDGAVGPRVLKLVAEDGKLVSLANDKDGVFNAATGIKVKAGKWLWVQNGGLVWVIILVIMALLAYLGMNNMPFHECGTTPVAIAKFLWLTILGYVGAIVGIAVLLSTYTFAAKTLWTFVVIIAAVPTTMLCMRFLTPRETKQNLQGQFGILKMKHNWVMTYLYVMTFGSFIGYANAFPKVIKDVFDTDPGPYAWLGAGVGALIRPLGGWLSDKVGGARVTHWDTIVMIGATIGAGYCVQLAIGNPEDPGKYFIPFLLLFILLFATTGIGNGSTFRMIGVIFSRDSRGPILGWTSAIAAYGAYLIPKIFGNQIADGTPHYALYGFAGYYATCLVLNWWFYARKNAEIPC